MKRPGRLSRCTRLVALFALIIVAGAAPDASNAARYQPPAPVSLTPHYKYLGYPAAQVNGDYVLRAPMAWPVVLLDDRTGRTYSVPAPSGCDTAVAAGSLLGTGWIGELCGEVPADEHSPVLALYAVPNGPWKYLPSPGATPGRSGPCGATRYFCQPDAIGRHWIEYGASCYHCQSQLIYQDTLTGAEGSPALSATQRLDLNSRSLIKHLCKEVSAPAGDRIAYYGRYVVVTEHPGGPYTNRYVLHRCGTRLRQVLASGSIQLSGNSKLLAWFSYQLTDQGRANVGATHISGIFLRSRQRFAVALPRAFRALQLLSVQATSKHLFVYGLEPRSEIPTPKRGLWSAPLPMPQQSPR